MIKTVTNSKFMANVLDNLTSFLNGNILCELIQENIKSFDLFHKNLAISNNYYGNKRLNN